MCFWYIIKYLQHNFQATCRYSDYQHILLPIRFRFLWQGLIVQHFWSTFTPLHLKYVTKLFLQHCGSEYVTTFKWLLLCFQFSKTLDIDFLAWRFWIGVWVFIFALVMVATESSYLVKYVTRFTEEIFAFLISMIFSYEVLVKLIKVSAEIWPIKSRSKYTYHSKSFQ